MGLIRSLKNTGPGSLLLCKSTVLSALAWFSLLAPLKTGLGIFSQETVLSRFTLLHQKPIDLPSQAGSDSWSVRFSADHPLHARLGGPAARSTDMEGPRPSRQPKFWLFLPSKELALQGYSVSSTISLQARLHKLSEEVSFGFSVGAIHRDALFLQPVTLCLHFVTCPWGKGWAEEKQLTPGVRTIKEERNSTERKKERGKAKGAKQAEESKTANVLTASRTKAFSDVFPDKLLPSRTGMPSSLSPVKGFNAFRRRCLAMASSKPPW